MTKKDLQNCLKIVNSINKDSVYGTTFLSKELDLSESYIIYLLTEFILPNKLLSDNGTPETGFALVNNNLTKYFLENNKLKKKYNEYIAEQKDIAYRRKWNKFKAISFWPLFIISIIGGIYNGYKFFSEFNKDKVEAKDYVDKKEFNDEFIDLKKEISK